MFWYEFVVAVLVIKDLIETCQNRISRSSSKHKKLGVAQYQRLPSMLEVPPLGGSFTLVRYGSCLLGLVPCDLCSYGVLFFPLQWISPCGFIMILNIHM